MGEEPKKIYILLQVLNYKLLEVRTMTREIDRLKIHGRSKV